MSFDFASPIYKKGVAVPAGTATAATPTAIPGVGPMYVYNPGSVVINVISTKLTTGTPDDVADATCMPVAPGERRPFRVRETDTHLSAYCGTNAQTLYVTRG